MDHSVASGTVLTATSYIRTDGCTESPSGGQTGDIRGHRICYFVYAYGASCSGVAKFYIRTCTVDPRHARSGSTCKRPDSGNIWRALTEHFWISSLITLFVAFRKSGMHLCNARSHSRIWRTTTSGLPKYLWRGVDCVQCPYTEIWELAFHDGTRMQCFAARHYLLRG